MALTLDFFILLNNIGKHCIFTVLLFFVGRWSRDRASSYNGIAPGSIPGVGRTFGLPVDPADNEWVAILFRPSEVNFTFTLLLLVCVKTQCSDHIWHIYKENMTI